MTPALEIESEEQLRAWLEDNALPEGEDLLPLLDEAHPLYRDLSGPAVVRVRGALLLTLGRGPLSEEALPYVLEELESAHDAYLTAAAAHLLRTASEPSPAYVGPLLSALLYIRHRDDKVSLSHYGGQGPRDERTTAMAEVLHTLGWLGAAGRSALPRLRALREESPGPHTTARIDAAVEQIEATHEAPVKAASCCCASSSPPMAEPRVTRPADIADVELQDQNGERLRFGEFFAGKPSIVVFFYTRCENPTKCPLTISKLGRLQRLLREEGLEGSIRTAAITYDPAFDLPARLEQYGRSWGAVTDPDHRLLRTTGDFAPLQSWFDLGVNYVSSVVNRHRLDAYVLDTEGRIAAAVTRMRWSEQELLETARSLLRTGAELRTE